MQLEGGGHTLFGLDFGRDVGDYYVGLSLAVCSDWAMGRKGVPRSARRWSLRFLVDIIAGVGMRLLELECGAFTVDTGNYYYREVGEDTWVV